MVGFMQYWLFDVLFNVSFFDGTFLDGILFVLPSIPWLKSAFAIFYSANKECHGRHVKCLHVKLRVFDENSW